MSLHLSILIAHGFTIDMVVKVIRAGLASAGTERMVAGGRSIDVSRLRITDAGRRALSGRKP